MRRRPALLGLLILALAAGAFAWLRMHAGDADSARASGTASGTQGPSADRPLLAAAKGRARDSAGSSVGAENSPAGAKASVPLRILVSWPYASKESRTAVVTIHRGKALVGEATTNEDGRVSFPAVPVGLVTVEAQAVGAYSGRFEWNLPADFTGEVPLSMEFQRTARGTVVDARDGKPVAGARLFVVESLDRWAREEWRPVPTTTDLVGAFSLRWGAGPKDDGERMLVVVARGYGTFAESLWGSTPRDPKGPATIRMEPGGSIRGTVRARDGSPVEGARVTIVPQGLPLDPGSRRPPGQLLVARTDDQGRYAIDGLLLDAVYAATADTEGLARAADGHDLVPTAAAPDLTADFVLDEPGSIALTVVADDGTPLPNAVCAIVKERERTWLRTDGSGSVAFGRLTPGAHSVRVELEGWAPAVLIVEVSEGQRIAREVRLERGVTIKGAVIDDQGAPIRGLRVTARGPGEYLTSETDDDGHFVVSGLHSGTRYTMSAGAGEPTRVDAPASSVRLVVGRAAPRGDVVVRVKPPAGERAPEVLIVGRDAESVADDGVYAFALPVGHQTLRFRAKGFLSFEREVDVVADHETEIPEVSLERGEDLVGRVIDLRGQPVANAVVLTRVGLDLIYNEFDRSETRTTTDADGRFRLERQSHGPLKVEVFADGFLSPDETRDWNGGAETMSIVLHKAATIRGRALDAKGRGVADVPVWIFEGEDYEHSQTIENAETDVKGRFSVAIKPGNYTIVAVDAHNVVGRLAVDDEGEANVEFHVSTK